MWLHIYLFRIHTESEHEYVLLSVIFVALIKIMHSRLSVFYKFLISFFIRAEQNFIFENKVSLSFFCLWKTRFQCYVLKTMPSCRCFLYPATKHNLNVPKWFYLWVSGMVLIFSFINNSYCY